jgi:ubiquitin-like modifier-activating enzyme 5
VTKYLGYNALLDYFPTMTLRPNENCADSFCVKRQKEFQIRENQRLAEEANKVIEKEIVEENLHPENEFRMLKKFSIF